MKYFIIYLGRQEIDNDTIFSIYNIKQQWKHFDYTSCTISNVPFKIFTKGVISTPTHPYKFNILILSWGVSNLFRKRKNERKKEEKHRESTGKKIKWIFARISNDNSTRGTISERLFD